MVISPSPLLPLPPPPPMGKQTFLEGLFLNPVTAVRCFFPKPRTGGGRAPPKVDVSHRGGKEGSGRAQVGKKFMKTLWVYETLYSNVQMNSQATFSSQTTGMPTLSTLNHVYWARSCLKSCKMVCCKTPDKRYGETPRLYSSSLLLSIAMFFSHV